MHKPIRQIIIAALLSLTTVPMALAETFKLDPAHSFVQFSISHLGFSMLQGRFNTLEGEFSYDEKNPANASIQMTVQVGSIDSNHAERDKHLRSKDFFNVSKYPTSTFKSTRFRELGDNKAILEGELTLMGVTKPISVDIEFIGAGNDPWGGYRRGYVGKTTLTRSDFGMDYNLGPAAETVDMLFVVEGIRQ